MTLRRLLAVAGGLGLLTGLVLALALPANEPLRAQTAAPTIGKQSTARVKHVPGEPRFEVRPGSVRLALRVRDPAGAAPWAVRLVESRAILDQVGRPPRRTAWAQCAQLGRLVGGRFGWITEAAGFADVRPSERARVPEACQSRRRLMGREVATSLITIVRAGRDGVPGPARTIAFGRLGRRATDVKLTYRGQARPGRVEGGAFLTFAPADPGVRDLRVRLSFSGGPDRDRDLSGAVSAGEIASVVRLNQGTPQIGNERIVARTPDPAGGPPYGLLAVRSSRPGQWCPGQSTRILGRRGGFFDTRLEIFRADISGFFCGDDRSPLTTRRPVQILLSRSGASQGQDVEAGRIQRRSLPGRTILTGTAHPSVRVLEVITSRDQRTLVPDRQTGAFITAYDGNLPGESVKVTASLTDGTQHTARLGTSP